MSDARRKTMIVTGASQGIGAGATKSFLKLGYNVVANSRRIIESSAFAPDPRLALVDGDISQAATAVKIAAAAIEKFGSIDGVVNNAGLFFSKRFTDYTLDDFALLSETNLAGYIHITQLAVKQMLAQKQGGSVIAITRDGGAPHRRKQRFSPDDHEGGLEAITRSLAMEYAKEGIRFNAVSPGIVDTPMHEGESKEFLKGLSPMGEISDVDDVVEAIVYLTEARHVTGEILYVDAGAHIGEW